MQFTLHRTFPDPEPLSSQWNGLLAEGITNVPFLRHEYLSAWWATRGGGEWPASAELALVTAEQDGRLAGVAPLFFADNREGVPSLLLLGSIEISDYLDLIVRPADLETFLSGLLDFLGASPIAWQNLDWQNLLETSPSLPLLGSEAGRRGWSFSVERTYHAPAIPLPGDFETYLSGIDKKQRHEIRRKMRRAEELGGMHWYIVEDASTLDAEVNAFLDLMATDPQKDAFLTDVMRSQMSAAVLAAFKAGWLQLAFLTVNGEKAAGYLDFDYQDRIWVYNSGIDWRFKEYSPGWVLLGHLLQWANENRRLEFDFMRGDEDYKYRFGGVDRFVVRAKLAR
jgi:CelD/BcsL family acetyltransferase involved in cellulose biosynthesis